MYNAVNESTSPRKSAQVIDGSDLLSNILSPEDVVQHPEVVNHPKHYGGESDPYEAIKVIEAWDLNFNLGNCLKYINRAGKKYSDPALKDAKTLEDLKKAAWYMQREVERFEKELQRKGLQAK